MRLIETFRTSEFNAPTLVIALKGWVDGGAVASHAGQHLSGDGPVVARFNPDGIYDYAGRRPAITFDSGTSSAISWPDLAVRHNHVSGLDVLVLVGDEPQIGWKTVASDMSELAVQYNVQRVVTLGALPAQVPHTRPTNLLVTSTDENLQSFGVPSGRFVVPAAAANAIDHHLKEELGLPTAGFWAQVPHYVTGVYWPGVVSLVERVGMYLGASIDVSALAGEAAEMIARLDLAVSERPEAREFLNRIEQAQESLDEGMGQNLANEVEDFLRSIGEDENPFA